jgi:hypothetical protein
VTVNGVETGADFTADVGTAGARYVVLGSNKNWDGATTWALASGGTTGAAFKPAAGDGVIIDANSGNGRLDMNENTPDSLAYITTTGGAGVTLLLTDRWFVHCSGNVNWTGLAAITNESYMKLDLTGTGQTVTVASGKGRILHSLFIADDVDWAGSTCYLYGRDNGDGDLVIPTGKTLDCGANPIYIQNSVIENLDVQGAIVTTSSVRFNTTTTQSSAAAYNLNFAGSITAQDIYFDKLDGAMEESITLLHDINATITGKVLVRSSHATNKLTVNNGLFVMCDTDKEVETGARGIINMGSNITCLFLDHNADGEITSNGYTWNLTASSNTDIDGKLNDALNLNFATGASFNVDLIPQSGNIGHVTVAPGTGETVTLNGNTAITTGLTKNGVGILKMDANGSTLSVLGGIDGTGGTIGHATWTGALVIGGDITWVGTFLSGNQTVTTGADGNWDTTGWTGNLDDIVIANTHSISVPNNGSLKFNTLTIQSGGNLKTLSKSPRYVTLSGPITVNAGGILGQSGGFPSYNGRNKITHTDTLTVSGTRLGEFLSYYSRLHWFLAMVKQMDKNMGSGVSD